MTNKSSKDGGADPGAFAVCHRLKSSMNKCMITKLLDLYARDEYLENANFFIGTDISLSNDSPSCLQPAQQELLSISKDLVPVVKKRFYINHHAPWPYMSLFRPNLEYPMSHSLSKEFIAMSIIAIEDPMKHVQCHHI